VITTLSPAAMICVVPTLVLIAAPTLTVRRSHCERLRRLDAHALVRAHVQRVVYANRADRVQPHALVAVLAHVALGDTGDHRLVIARDARDPIAPDVHLFVTLERLGQLDVTIRIAEADR
jgi:hypothetical protein